MPRGNGTGPMGQGPATGRGLGFCAGYNVPGYMQPGYGGRGFGRQIRGGGFGRGFGFGPGMGFRRGGVSYGYNWDYPPYSQEEEGTILKNQAKMLHEHLDSIEKRLSELEEQEKS